VIYLALDNKQELIRNPYLRIGIAPAFKEAVLSFGKGDQPITGKYQPDNALALLRSNCDEFTGQVIRTLQNKGLIDPDKPVDLKMGFGDPWTSLADEKHFVSHVVFNDIGVSDKDMADAIGFAAAETIFKVSEQSKENVKEAARRYTGPDVADANAIKCENVHNVTEQLHDIIMKQHDSSLGKSKFITQNLERGELYPCPEKKVELHKNGAIGITIANDDNSPKTVDGYRTTLCNQLRSLKDIIDNEIGLSDEESRKSTLDISKLFLDGKKSEFMVAFSGYDEHIDELKPALEKGIESLLGSHTLDLRTDVGVTRIGSKVLDDTTKFESPDIYQNATGLKFSDGHSLLKYGDRTFEPAKLKESLLPTESPESENGGMSK
jgi:hypothetical protein